MPRAFDGDLAYGAAGEQVVDRWHEEVDREVETQHDAEVEGVQ